MNAETVSIGLTMRAEIEGHRREAMCLCLACIEDEPRECLGMTVVPTWWGCLRCSHPAHGDVRVAWYAVDEETFSRRRAETMECLGLRP